MKLVIDAVGNRNSGGAVVLGEVLNAVRRTSTFKSVSVFISPACRRRCLPEDPRIRIIEEPRADTLFGRVLWAEKRLRDRLDGELADVFLGLNGIGPVGWPRPWAVFVQQAAPYSSEAMARCGLALKVRLRGIRFLTVRSVRAARHVLVQTNPMRYMLCDAAGLVPEKISVYMPAAPAFSDRRSGTLSGNIEGLWQGSMLYVGNDAPYKNLSTVASGIQMMRVDRRPDWLVTLPASSKVCRRGGAKPLGLLERDALRDMYRRATFLVMPSLVESLGLPLLEAMRLGTPVLAADRPYARAVCEDSALYFNPLSPRDFAEKATWLISDKALRTKLAAQGRAIVSRRDATDAYRSMIDRVAAMALIP